MNLRRQRELTARDPAHTYAQAGTYTVTLTVADRYGRSSSAVRPITVEDPGR